MTGSASSAATSCLRGGSTGAPQSSPPSLPISPPLKGQAPLAVELHAPDQVHQQVVSTTSQGGSLRILRNEVRICRSCIQILRADVGDVTLPLTLSPPPPQRPDPPAEHPPPPLPRTPRHRPPRPVPRH